MMLNRNPLVFVLALVMGVVIYVQAEWLSDRSGALAWQLLPWVFIILLWAFVLRNVLRSRAGRFHRS